MTLTISGNTLAQKNQKRIGYRYTKNGKKPFLIDNPEVKAWRKKAAEELALQWHPETMRVVDYPISVSMTFWFNSKHRRDIDNCINTVMDALVQAKVLVDDDWKHVSHITAQYGGLDKDNPRCEVEIED